MTKLRYPEEIYHDRCKELEIQIRDFSAVYINLDACYGPEGSLPLVRALQNLIGGEDASVYRGDGFALVTCPVTKEEFCVPEGCAVFLNQDGSLRILNP